MRSEKLSLAVNTWYATKPNDVKLRVDISDYDWIAIKKEAYCYHKCGDAIAQCCLLEPPLPKRQKLVVVANLVWYYSKHDNSIYHRTDCRRDEWEELKQIVNQKPKLHCLAYACWLEE